MARSDEVFITGGTPSITYVSRDDRKLEIRVERYLQVGRKVLTIAGPSKSGKSVLVERVLTSTQTKAIHLTGAAIPSIGDFWQRLAHRAGISATIELTSENSIQIGSQLSAKVGGGALPGELSSQLTSGEGFKVATRQVATTALSEAVKSHLCESGICLVVDDFHYAPADVRKLIAREIKDLIFRGARVILVAAPSRVLDLVQSEGELVGRVDRVQVENWTNLELMRIAALGFQALNLSDPQGRVASKLVEQSFGSPLLMQQLCLELCDHNGIGQTAVDGSRLLEEPYWNAFFGEIAKNFRPPVIEALKAGPMSRRRRKLRECQDGEFYDLYSAILIALNKLLPKREVGLPDLSDAVSEFMSNRPPMQDIRNTCYQMAKIARNQCGDGDLALDFKEHSHPQLITIDDPYLLFFLAWGLHELNLPTFRDLSGA